MPTVAKTSRELSPLDEEARPKKDTEGSVPNSTSCDLSTTVAAIGMHILTSRMPAKETAFCGDKDDNVATGELSGFCFENGTFSSSTFQVVPKVVPCLKHQLLNLKESAVPLCVEVKGCQKRSRGGENSSPKDVSLIIERWTIQTLPKRNAGDVATTTAQFLEQAVQSFLHFSQINSWTVSHGGNLPFDLAYRIYTVPAQLKRDAFSLCSPESHVFPLVSHSSLHYLRVSVEYLPRLEQIPSVLLPPALFRNAAAAAAARDASGLGQSTIAGNSPTSVAKSHQKSPRKDIHQATQASPRAWLERFPFSPPLSSPLSPKFLSGFSDHGACSTSGVTPDKHATGSVERSVAQPKPLLIPGNEHGVSSSNQITSPPGNTGFSRTSFSVGDSVNSGAMHTCSLQSSSVGRRHSVSTSYRTVTSAGSSACASMWMNGVRPPGASSPIPIIVQQRTSAFSRPISSKDSKRFHRLSCGVNMEPLLQHPPVRSMSLPASVPSLCLLGSFEESVLNGRLEPCGYVKGFSAELGASGSFCPQHITLPVTAAYFDLSDDGGPSPYLGHIDLSLVNKRGYRVPKKGTVQLTLFNPNMTVVRIFVVQYDHSDMPPATSTFVRQKNLSRPSNSPSTKEVLPSLHYLIHLRFLCSRSNRVYLHTDIKLIFTQRAPDTDPEMSKASFYSVTEGPTNPKYCPLNPD